eukprot:snap_masked-scaffold_19-processed-gene-5.12-mRNA-1 protein AED:1.00 eAED:1.00 QI:0/0/0/0/1/1/2/0/130
MQPLKTPGYPREEFQYFQETIYQVILVPEYEIQDNEPFQSEKEWVSANVIKFYNEIVYFNAAVVFQNYIFENTYAADHLLHEGYPPGVRYIWSDNENEPDRVLPVNKYLEKVLEWSDKEMEDLEILFNVR